MGHCSQPCRKAMQLHAYRYCRRKSSLSPSDCSRWEEPGSRLCLSTCHRLRLQKSLRYRTRSVGIWRRNAIISDKLWSFRTCDLFTTLGIHVTAMVFSVCALMRPCMAATPIDLGTTDISRQQYEAVTRLHATKSHLPSQGEARMLLELNSDLFTEDAWEGMKTIIEVAKLAEARMEDEKGSACSQCKDNRLLIEKAWQIIANEYYDPREQFSQAAWAKELLQVFQESGGPWKTKQESYKAIQTMMDSLHDRYTEFLTPTQFRKALRRPRPNEREYLERQYTGIGLQLGRHSSRGGWLVEGPLAESPAEAAGIAAGQRLIEIAGYPADLLSPLELSALMRGPSGSEVTVTLADPGQHPRLHLLQLECAALPQPPVKTARIPSEDGFVQYIRVHYFSSDASRAFESAMREAEKMGARGLLIDLRNNPGGVFEEAVSMASMMLEDGQVVAQTVRNSNIVDNTFRVGSLSKEVFPARKSPITQLPTAILINHGSASASEVFAAALQDNGRAVTVGEQSYGKGVVQHYFPFPDGSGLKVTVLKYLTPAGHDISKSGGIKADVMCSDFPHPGSPNHKNDSCIGAALRQMQL